jgi:hypothetical protein
LTYRTADLQSWILYIYSTNIGTGYFKNGIYSPFFSLQKAVCFKIPTYLVPVLFTFYIQDVLKLKNFHFIYLFNKYSHWIFETYYILSFFFFLQNAVCFIILTYLVPVLFTFHIQNVPKLKKNNSEAKRLELTNIPEHILMWGSKVFGMSRTRCHCVRKNPTRIEITSSAIKGRWIMKWTTIGGFWMLINFEC